MRLRDPIASPASPAQFALGTTARALSFPMRRIQEAVSKLHEVTFSTPESESQWATWMWPGFDLYPVPYEKVCWEALRLWRYNPLAHRIIEITKDFMIGEGLSFEASDPRVQDLLTAFWNDPVNRLEQTLDQRVREFLLYGELIIPVDTRNDVVRLGYLYPWEISKLERDEVYPFQVTKLHFRRVAYGTQQPLELDVIRPKLEDTEWPGYLQGEVFYFCFKRLMGFPRGMSLLLPLIDIADALDAFVFNSLKRSQYLLMWCFDVTCEGADQATINARRDELIRQPPEPAGFLIHNEAERWSVLRPELDARDITEEARFYESYLFGGAGFPAFMFGEGGGGRGGVTRATAVEMGEAAFKGVVAMQGHLRQIISFMFDFVIDHAIMNGKLPPDVNRSVRLWMPRPSVRDLQRNAGMLRAVSQALERMLATGTISPQYAREVFTGLVKQLGIRISEEALETLSKEERGKEQTGDIRD